MNKDVKYCTLFPFRPDFVPLSFICKVFNEVVLTIYLCHSRRSVINASLITMNDHIFTGE